MSNGMGATIVFGGSFNPPHLSHVLAVVTARAYVDCDRVLVVPTYRHYFQKALAPYEDRVAMCELAFEGLRDVEICTAERTLNGEGRTLDLLHYLQDTRKLSNLRLLVGADILLETHKWHRWDEVSRIAPPIVLGRASPREEENARLSAATAAQPTPDTPPILPAISSTEVRALFAMPDSPRLHAFVPRKVLAFARSRGLYTTA